MASNQSANFTCHNSLKGAVLGTIAATGMLRACGSSKSAFASDAETTTDAVECHNVQPSAPVESPAQRDAESTSLSWISVPVA